MSQPLAVTHLAEFVHRRGDLHNGLDGRTRAEEGIKAQRRLQRGKPDDYHRERRVERGVTLAGQRYLLAGRMDGCHLASHLIEEYKTTRSDHSRAHACHASTHWAQICLYGALLCHELDATAAQPWCLRLIYVHPDSLAITTFEQQWTALQLAQFLDETLTWYDQWLTAHRAHLRHRDQTVAGLAFPFTEYRPHQRAMAQRAYQALRDGEGLLLEAPTGSGKTMGLLYPAVKALSSAAPQRIFYLTSRSTGANAALAACQQLDPEVAYLRVVQITAKAQACIFPGGAGGGACVAAGCEYSIGYFDRVHAAVRDLLAKRAMFPDAIAEVAQRHRVCPFALSLDAARWADVIIGDYNYVFDPVVRLQRFVDDAQMTLLVDESHQLSSRAQEMLALALDRWRVRAALAEPIPQPLARRLRAIDRRLRELSASLAADGMAQVIAEPTALLAAIGRLVEELASGDIDLAAFPQFRDVAFACVRWIRARAWFEPDSCIYLGQAQVQAQGAHVAIATNATNARNVTKAKGQRRGGVAVSVRLVHLDPGAYLAKVFAGYASHIRFSGTVSPLDMYQRLHGLAGGPAERAGSPFAAEQLAVCVIDDVPTLYRRRQRGIPRLARLIATVVAAQPGNYLVAFPSFEYLQACAEQLQVADPRLNLFQQTPAMSPEGRAEFLARLQQSDDGVVAMVVLGGVFAESVNLASSKGSTLAGVICVGIGIPPPSVERDAMAEYFDAQGEDGAGVAYRQPAMTKVLQVAGRLLRDPADRGVLVLVDARFKDPSYQRFFPAHWQVASMAADAVASALEIFWRPPRLPAATSSAPELATA